MLTETPSLSRLPYVTPDEAAVMLRTTRRAVYALIDRGFLAKCVRRLGRRVLLNRAELLALIEAGDVCRR